VLATLGADSFGSLQSPVQMVSLPSAAVINTWNYDWDNGPTVATDITLSSSGLLLGQVIQGIGHVASGRQVTAASGGPILWSDSNFLSPIFLSHDETLIAVSVDDTPLTNVYLNDQLSTQLPGNAVGWLADHNILQNVTGNDVVYAATGAPVSGRSLPPLTGPIQVVTSDSIYDGSSNAIYSLSSGAKTWSGTASSGVFAGSRIAYVVGNQLVTEPY